VLQATAAPRGQVRATQPAKHGSARAYAERANAATVRPRGLVTAPSPEG